MSVEGGGSPRVLEAVPQALAVAPQAAVRVRVREGLDKG